MRVNIFFIIIALLVGGLGGCGSHPLNQTPTQQIESIRRFMADMLDPIPAVKDPQNSFREISLKHLIALYYVINTPELLKESHLPEGMLASIPQKELEGLRGHSIETIAKKLQEQDPKFFRDYQEKLDKSIQEFQFEVKDLSAIQVPKLGRSWTRFFQGILENYFPSLAMEDRKRILAFMIRNTKPTDTPTQALLSWVYASGPFFQKYLQLMADYLVPGDNPELKELQEGLQKVKKGLPHIPKQQMQAYLQELKNKGYELEDLRSLGAASVGEAFLAKDKKTGREIVVKFKRPGIEKIAARERQFFLKQAQEAQGDALKDSFADIAAQINEEFDYRLELKKIKEGISAYENDPRYPIHVVKPVEDFPNSDRYFAMELVRGKTFESLDKTNYHQWVKGLLWTRITHQFLDRALFAEKDAFFHGDLHEGNIMVVLSPELKLGPDATREQVQQAIDQGLIYPVLIDFGNAHSLTQEERRRLRDMFVSAAKISNSSQAFLEALMPGKHRPDLVELLNETAFSPEHREDEPAKKIGAAMDVLLQNNVPIPGFIMAFKRSVAMLGNIYETLKLEQQSAIHPLKTIAQNVFIDEKNLKQLLSEMSPVLTSSLLNGLVLDAQAYEFEGEQVAAFFQQESLKQHWMRLRTEWAKEQDPHQKEEDFFGLANFLADAWVHAQPKQPQQPQQEQQNKQDKPDKQDKKDIQEPGSDFWFNFIASGEKTLPWESQQVASFWKVDLQHPIVEEYKRDRAELAQVFRKGKKEWVPKALKLATYLPPSLKKSFLDRYVLQGAAKQLEGVELAKAFEDPSLKDKWVQLRTEWAAEKDPEKKQKNFFEMLNLVADAYLSKRASEQIKASADTAGATAETTAETMHKASEDIDFKQLVFEQFISGELLDWEAEQIAAIWNVQIDDPIVQKYRGDRENFADLYLSGKATNKDWVHWMIYLPHQMDKEVVQLATKFANGWWQRQGIKWGAWFSRWTTPDVRQGPETNFGLWLKSLLLG